MKYAFIVLMLMTSAAQAQRGGSEGTGGGDVCEQRIQEIRDDIAIWIQKGGPQELAGLSMSTDEYSRRMLYFLSKAPTGNGTTKATTAIECVQHAIEVQGTEKVCRFDRTAKGSKIKCNAQAFMNPATMTADDQYRLVHHEYAGLAEIEMPSNSQSNYIYSNQLVAFLENRTVRKLALKPVTLSSSAIVEFPEIGFFDIPSDSKFVFTKPFSLPAATSNISLGWTTDMVAQEGACLMQQGRCQTGSYEQTVGCEFRFDSAPTARSLDLGSQGYRALNFEYGPKNDRVSEIRFKDNGRNLFSLVCTNYNFGYPVTVNWVKFMRKAGIKLLTGQGQKF